jgi:hypothetical protein
MSFVSDTHLFEKAHGNAHLIPSRRLEVNSSSVIVKPTRCANFSNLFWNETVHV